MSSFFHSYPNPDSKIELVIEDNGRAAYAYLVSDKSIAADVRLYNSAKAPEIPEWDDKTKLPFMNPVSFSNQPDNFQPMHSSDRITVSWQIGNAGVSVKIFIDE